MPPTTHHVGPALRLTGLRKEYATRHGPVVALDGVSLTVAAGEVHGVVGRSGAGKSTLIRCLTLLDRPSEGTVELGGVEVTHLSDRQLRTARRNIGLVFQQVALLDSRTVLGNVAYPLEVARRPRVERRARARQLLGLVGLADEADRYPAQLSGGQRQRVGIARALATEPALLLCDEPTSALDAATTEEVLSTLLDLRARLGVAIVLVTHEMDVVRRACDSVSLLHDGQVVETGPVRQVVAARGSRLARDLVATHAVRPPEGQVLVEVVFATAETSTRAILARLVALGSEVSVASAALWSVDGLGLGRVHLAVAASGGPGIVDRLVAEGLDARVVTS